MVVPGGGCVMNCRDPTDSVTELAVGRWRRSVVRVNGLMFLRFLKLICLSGLLKGDRVGSSIEMTLWSYKPRSCIERLLMGVELRYNQSRVGLWSVLGH